MHRPTTTAAAALLVTMAVSAATSAAVSGCMSADRPSGSGQGPAAATAPPPVPRTEEKRRPVIVQAPAREALERMGPPSHPATRKATSETESETASEAESEADPATGPSTPSPPRTHRPAPASAATPVRRPAATRPDAGATRPAPAKAPTGPDTNVCALGEAYGKWRPNSPEAVICRNTYGR
ncbi:hypothetical protein ABZ921_35310 [Streptomyces atriruber]|uniref:Lipoprotein n=1 Tax=Streptomyces atriruber TaxID=545121 RepID=A0ABV3BY16_9ACTN